MIDTDKFDEFLEQEYPRGVFERELWHTTKLLLDEVKRLRKLEAAVVGSWMETINRGSSWHKQLRDPCVELGYLTYNDGYELPEEYQDMAKEWVKEYYGDDEE